MWHLGLGKIISGLKTPTVSAAYCRPEARVKKSGHGPTFYGWSGRKESNFKLGVSPNQQVIFLRLDGLRI